eukprot:scaffold2422_cov81-Phaeocystis_antarctica.AAC.1
MVYRRTSRISITFCSLLGQAFSHGTAQQLPISKCVWPVPTGHAAASAAAPQGWRSPTCARQSSGCQVQASGAPLSQAGKRRLPASSQARAQLAPRGHYALGTCTAARVPPLDEQPPGPPLDRQPLSRSTAIGHGALLDHVEQCSEVGEAMRHELPARAPRHLEAQHVRHVRPDVDQAVARHLLPAHH